MRARLTHLGDREDHLVLVAEADARVVGWVHATVMEYIEVDAFAVIGGLVVDASHRHLGIGRRLVGQVEEWARQRGCSIVRLWSSTARAAAHAFYERLGYTNIKTQYSFVKSLDPSRRNSFEAFVPRVNESAE